MTRKPSPLPDFNVKVVQPGGDMHPDWYRFFANFRASLGEAIDVIDAPLPIPEIEMAEQWPFGIAFPEDGDYVIIQNNDVERTIYATTTDANAGTCTVTFKINSTALGGAAHSVTSTESIISRTTANVLGVGDDLIATVSSNSDCEKLRLNAHTTRTIVTST